MLYEYIFVKELRVGTTKNTNKSYPIAVDQSGNYWRFFNGEHVEINKAFTIGYEISEDGQYKNVKQVIPLANVFKNEALKELASKSDITRNVSIAVTQAIQALALQGDLQSHEDLFAMADRIYGYVKDKTEDEYEKINNNGIPSPKEIKTTEGGNHHDQSEFTKA